MSDVRESLDLATVKVEALRGPVVADEATKAAILALLDVVSQLAALLGVPGAIEPDDPATPDVET